jgi:predicted lysophospholipase L1 biosynthesis ABC-type transport system permease subunit
MARQAIGECREVVRMNELLLFLLGIAAVFLILCSVALLALGKMIDACPTGKEDRRERSFASPVESTKLAVVMLWALFFPGVWAVLQENRITLILGITTLFSVCLFMLTALIFSVAVLSTIKRKRNAIGEIERQADIDSALIHLEKVTGVRAVCETKKPEKHHKPIHSGPIATNFFKQF